MEWTCMNRTHQLAVLLFINCYCYLPMEMKQTRRICPKGYGIAQIVLCMGALSSVHGFCPLCVVPSDVSLLHLNTYALSPGGHVHSVS